MHGEYGQRSRTPRLGQTTPSPPPSEERKRLTITPTQVWNPFAPVRRCPREYGERSRSRRKSWTRYLETSIAQEEERSGEATQNLPHLDCMLRKGQGNDPMLPQGWGEQEDRAREDPGRDWLEREEEEEPKAHGPLDPDARGQGKEACSRATQTWITIAQNRPRWRNESKNDHLWWMAKRRSVEGVGGETYEEFQAFSWNT